MKILTKSATSPLPARLTAAAVAIAGAQLAVPAFADQVILDDLIVDGSVCVGQDCVNGESFGFDTLRLKENNLRIKAQDTSTSASFPSTDWQITFNDSNNGGQNRFSVEDISASRVPFTIEGNAPSHSLYVDDGGRIGLGTSAPVVDIHVKSGNSPTLRLEQDGTSGFTAQTWDLAGNEANFFIRDATNGSTLPFRVFPKAPSNAIAIEGTTGDVGIGTNTPEGSLHIRKSGNVIPLIESSSGAAVQLRLKSNSTNRRFIAVDGSNAVKSQLVFGDDEVLIAGANDTSQLFATFDSSGIVIEGGSITVNGTPLAVPDYVFAKDYELMPLKTLEAYINENKHLPEIPSATEVAANGLDITAFQLSLLKKVEELTLYVIDQQNTITALNTQVEALEGNKQGLAD